MPADQSRFQPKFRLATAADAELLLDFMRDYYAFDGNHYEREPARKALRIPRSWPSPDVVARFVSNFVVTPPRHH